MIHRDQKVHQRIRRPCVGVCGVLSSYSRGVGDPTKLIVIGGFAGSGKSTASRRLATDLRVPRLRSDTIGRTVRASVGADNVDAYRVAYDVLFVLADEFMQAGVSAVLDLTIGWEFQWRAVDRVRDSNPNAEVVPLILSCPHSVCMARIARRHAADPSRYLRWRNGTARAEALAGVPRILRVRKRSRREQH